MNLWTLVILILAVSMALGPLLMLQPSRRDQREATLRARAMAYQLSVSLEPLPRQATDMEEPRRTPVYSLSQPRGRSASNWLLVRGSYQHEWQFLGWWRWQSEARPSDAEIEVLRAWLPDLPESVQAVGANRKGWYAYWTEYGGETVLAQLAEGLGKIRDCSRLPASAQD